MAVCATTISRCVRSQEGETKTMGFMDLDRVGNALTAPFGNHRCKDVSDIESVEDFYDDKGRRIQGYMWLPKSTGESVGPEEQGANENRPELRGLVLFSHGYNHFMDNFYGQFGAQFNSLGFAAAGVDWPGHGDSEGTRCHIDEFDEIPQSLLKFLDEVVSPRLQKYLQKESAEDVFSELPVFIYGESMGAAAALRAEALRPDFFRGLLLSAPLCGIDPELMPPPFVVSLGQCISKVLPTAPVVPGEDHTDKCFKDPVKFEKVKNSTKRYTGRMRLRMGMELDRICRVIQSETPNLKCPICILHSSTDKVTQPSQSRMVYDGCSSEDKTYIQYEGAYHVLFWEPTDTRKQLGEDIFGWFLTRTQFPQGRIKQSAFIHRLEGQGDLTDSEVFLLE